MGLLKRLKMGKINGFTDLLPKENIGLIKIRKKLINDIKIT